MTNLRHMLNLTNKTNIYSQKMWKNDINDTASYGF